MLVADCSYAVSSPPVGDVEDSEGLPSLDKPGWYSQGNWLHLHELLKIMTGKPEPKVSPHYCSKQPGGRLKITLGVLWSWLRWVFLVEAEWWVHSRRWGRGETWGKKSWQGYWVWECLVFTDETGPVVLTAALIFIENTMRPILKDAT